MSKIKFKLVKFEKALAFQVLEMDERFRCECFIDEHKVNLDVYSGGGVELRLDENIILLRGSVRAADLDIEYANFNSNSKRDKLYDKIIKSLKNWANNWEGFKDDKEINDSEATDTFEF